MDFIVDLVLFNFILSELGFEYFIHYISDCYKKHDWSIYMLCFFISYGVELKSISPLFISFFDSVVIVRNRTYGNE